ncbi:hypothetical protein NWF24_15795 [Variovorax paradoxus]|uniref:hypothetical protein n=1 Tax=Variovorax TaxID=34072 RepID=UPI00089CE1A1|nr:MULTISPECIES: hypothetical protein [Variovorax]UVH60821.1 hypothetical protein NWF24_15795 [Variovorax paradoxus]SDY72413.1 hypothetical protein SAMN05518854_102376 [Variovorax sp. YR266]
MNDYDYEAFRTAIEDSFISLYAIDAASLTAAQRKVHQKQLNTTYLALLKVENNAFASLTGQAKITLAGLSSSVLLLQSQLAGFKKAQETLEIVADFLGVLETIVTLLP